MTERKPERDADAVWKTLADQADEDRAVDEAIRDVEAMSEAEKAWASKDAGIDGGAVASVMQELLSKHAVPVKPAPRETRPEATVRGRWTTRRILLVAAVSALVPGAFLATGGGALVVGLWKTPIRPEDSAGPDRSSPLQLAAATRAQAFPACDAQQWATCEQKLDEAQHLDPAGEDDPRVRAARQSAYDGLHPENRPPTAPSRDKPGPPKPPPPP